MRCDVARTTVCNQPFGSSWPFSTGLAPVMLCCSRNSSNMAPWYDLLHLLLIFFNLLPCFLTLAPHLFIQPSNDPFTHSFSHSVSSRWEAFPLNIVSDRDTESALGGGFRKGRWLFVWQIDMCAFVCCPSHLRGSFLKSVPEFVRTAP